MPRGVDRYDTARVAGRLWTPLADRSSLYSLYDAFDPGSITFFSTTTDQLTVWKDKSGRGSHLTVVGNSPRWTPYKVRVNGILDVVPLTVSVAFPLTTWDFFAVANPNSTPTGAANRTLLYKSGGDTWYIFLISSNAVGSYHTGGSTHSQAGTMTWPPSQLSQIYCSVPSATGVVMALDGGALQAETGENVQLTATPSVMDSGNVAFGDIHEMVFTATSRPSFERERMQGYLAHKWDRIIGGSTLVSALPGSHPFKNRPPLIGD